MDTCCTCQLGQTADRILNFSRRNHHKIRKLVHDDHDLRHLLRCLFSLRDPHIGNLFVIFSKITYPIFRKSIVTAGHLGNSPVQRTGRFLRICDHRNEQVRDPVIYTELHHLRIDHDQTHLIRCSLIKDADDQRIDADGFSGAGCSGDKKMRHLGNICHYRFSGNILTCCKGQLGFCIFKLL